MPFSTKPRIAVVGAGPAGLAAAEAAARGGALVTVYDRMPSPGRKFLMAGRGGLNLTHAEPFEAFAARYGAAAAPLRAALDAFPPEALRAWSEGLGEPTFVGTSGRVFPRSLKASPLLRVWLRRLSDLGVTLRLRHRWIGWSPEGALRFETQEGSLAVESDAAVLALGGASWPRLGSDGRWTAILEGAGVTVTPLQPSNCGFLVDWSPFFRDRFEGTPLKNIALRFGDRLARGDLVATRAGLEGGPLYALSPLLREAIARDGCAVAHLALRPDLSPEGLRERLGRRAPKQSTATHLRKALRLPPVAIALLHEGHGAGDLDLAGRINHLPLRLVAAAPLAEAISTAGGVALAEVDGAFMLRRRPGTFLAGEMLDWEAPTGGYLLQACFATGLSAGRGALRFLGRTDQSGDGSMHPGL